MLAQFQHKRFYCRRGLSWCITADLHISFLEPYRQADMSKSELVLVLSQGWEQNAQACLGTSPTLNKLLQA